MHRLACVSLTPALALVALATPTWAGPKRVVPALLTQARYVCLGYDVGSGFLSDTQAISAADQVFPEDRRALEAIRDEIERWDKYSVVVRPEQAELLIAVRTGRRAGLSIGVGGGRGGFGSGSGRLAGGELSSPHDLFIVYEARGGRPGAQLWRVQKRGALAGSPPAAFEEFRTAVESAPAPTPKPAPPER